MMVMRITTTQHDCDHDNMTVTIVTLERTNTRVHKFIMTG